MDIRAFYLRKKFWLNDFFGGSSMWKEYRDVVSIRKNIERGGVKRKEYIKEILSFAKNNTKFYAGIRASRLEEFPVVDKQTILQHYSDFLVPTAQIPGQKGELHIQHTSGSTGTPFSIPQDTRCRIRRIATIKAENESIGFHSFIPMMHLRAVKHHWNDGRGDIYYDKKLNIVYADNANLTDEKLEKIIDAANRYKVRFIRGYMTTLDMLTRYSLKSGKELVTRPFFISVGEPLLETLRMRIVNDLGCHVISQYANEENGVFGSSAIDEPGDRILLNRANCYVEILKMDSDEPVGDNELGRIVVTDFVNHALPLIRYDIGDVAMRDEEQDGDLLSVKSFSGRKTDLIYTASGDRIDLFNSISPEIFNNPALSQWQFIQHTAKNYTLRISYSDEGIKQSAERFSSLMKEILGEDAEIRIEFTKEIPVLNSGKRRIVVCEYKKQER